MATKHIFQLGDYVSCKKWSGEPVLGIYAYGGRDGSHFIVAENNKRWNIKPNDCKLATKEEEKIIKTKIEPKLGNFKIAMLDILSRNPMARNIANIKSKKKEDEELVEIMTMA